MRPAPTPATAMSSSLFHASQRIEITLGDLEDYVNKQPPMLRARYQAPSERQALLNKSGKEVFLRGDGAVQLQDLLEVMDRLKNAGVEKVGIVARLPGER